MPQQDLAIIVRAGVDQLANDLGRAQSMLRAFGREAERNSPKTMFGNARDIGGASFKAMATDMGRMKSAATDAATAVKSLGVAIGRASTFAVAFDNPFAAASAAASVLARTVETPFRLAGAAAKGSGALLSAPFRGAGTALSEVGRVTSDVFGRIGRGAGTATTELTGVFAGVTKSAGRAADLAGRSFRALAVSASKNGSGMFAGMSRGAGTAATELLGVFVGVTKNGSGLFSGLFQKAGPALAGFGRTAGVTLGRVAQVAGRSADFVGRSFGAAAAGAGKAFDVVGKSIGASLDVGLRGAVAVASAAFGEIRDSIRMASDLEQTKVSFEVMLGDPAKAEGMISDLRKFAAQTPFNSRETFDAAKQLLAYGTTAEQIVPVLRVLGEYSAAFGDKLNLDRATFLFGTLQTQGRAYTRDLQQLAGSGVPIYELLGRQFGKTTAEIQDMTEAGRFGIEEVGAAMELGTRKGERFHGMIEKQSKTLRGMWEIAKDAFDVAKTKFGQIIIDETGLKEATQDFEKFSQRLERGLDRVRPFVKFMGDLGRSVVQVGYEFGKAAVRMADFGGSMFGAGFPELRKLSEDFGKMVKDAANFRIDPRSVNNLMFSFAKGFTETLANAMEGVADLGQGLMRNLVHPVQQAGNAIRQIFIDTKDFIGAASVSEKFRPPMAFEKDSDIVQRYRNLQAAIQDNRNQVASFRVDPNDKNATVNQKDMPTLLRLSRERDELHTAQREFLKQDIFLEGRGGQSEENRQKGLNHILAIEGRVPVMQDRQSIFTGEDGFLKRGAKEMRDRIPAMDEERQRINLEFDASDRLAATEKAAEGLRKVAEESDRVSVALSGFLRTGGLQSILGHMGPVPRVAAEAFDASPARSDRMQSALKDVPLFKNMVPQNLLQFPRKMPEDVREFSNRIKDEQDPLREVNAFKVQIDRAVQFGGLSKEEGDRAYGDKVKDVAGRLGFDGGNRLAPAAIVGSVEDARLRAQHMVGGPKMTTTESFLKVIATHTAHLKELAALRAGGGALGPATREGMSAAGSLGWGFGDILKSAGFATRSEPSENMGWMIGDAARSVNSNRLSDADRFAPMPRESMGMGGGFMMNRGTGFGAALGMMSPRANAVEVATPEMGGDGAIARMASLAVGNGSGASEVTLLSEIRGLLVQIAASNKALVIAPVPTPVDVTG